MNNNYLIESNDFVTISKQIEKIIKDNNFTNEIVNTYDLEESLLSQVLEDLDTYSLFSNKKVIVVKNASFLENNSKISFNEKEINHLLKYLQNSNPDILLIICVKKLDLRKKLTKEIKKYLNVVKNYLTPYDIINDELEGFDISFRTKNLLIDYVNEDLSLLQTECNKLKMYKYNEKNITKEDIENIVFKVQKDSEKILFELVNSIVIKDKKKAFKAYLDLTEYNYEPIAIIALLESQLRLIYQVSLALEDNLSTKEIATMLKVHPFRVEKSIISARSFTREDLNKFISDLAKLDLDIKSGVKDSKLGFKLFLINL